MKSQEEKSKREGLDLSDRNRFEKNEKWEEKKKN